MQIMSIARLRFAMAIDNLPYGEMQSWRETRTPESTKSGSVEDFLSLVSRECNLPDWQIILVGSPFFIRVNPDF